MSRQTATARVESIERESEGRADEPFHSDDDDALRSSAVRVKARSLEGADDRSGGHVRDSVDRYLQDLDGTSRITPAEEVALSQCLLSAAKECLAVASEAGVRAAAICAVDGALSVPGGEPERDAIIQSLNRLWRLLDEHADALGDSRRTGMVGMVEEELGCDAPTLARIRCDMAGARARALHARQTMTRANLALVVSVAKVYRNRGVPMADLIQEGNISLWSAVEKFDPERGARLGTYATVWLHRSMRRTVRSLSRTVRLPESAKSARSRSVPIDEPVGQERLSLTDVLCHPDAIAPDDVAAREQIRSRARQHLSGLSAQEALVVRRRFGIEHPTALTLREIGVHLGLTRERVRQIEKSALDKLRRRMRRDLSSC